MVLNWRWSTIQSTIAPPKKGLMMEEGGEDQATKNFFIDEENQS